MAAQGLSAADTATLVGKLRELRESVAKDAQLIESQKSELAEKTKQIDAVYDQLLAVRKELLSTGGALTSSEFRGAMTKYLKQIREEIVNLSTNQASRYLKPKPLNVVISGAAGQIGYSLVPLVATGQVFGLDTPVSLRLLEIPRALTALKGVALEIDDGAYPLVSEIICTADLETAFSDADFAILVGGFPRQKGMLRADLLAKNAPIFKSMGSGLQKYAKETCKVLVIANPANTNCLTAAMHAPKIPKTNFAALTRLDYNRARGQFAKKAGVRCQDVRNMIIWGNHSKTQVPDVNSASIIVDGVKKEFEIDDKWVRGDFTSCIQSRGKQVLEARGFSSAMSAANAVKDCLRDWYHGTPTGEHVAMAVWSTGNGYGIANDIFYSFPCECKDGEATIVGGVRVSDEVRGLMKASEKELLEEKKEAGF